MQVFTQAAVAVATASRAVGGRALRGGEAAFRDAGRRVLVNGVITDRQIAFRRKVSGPYRAGD